MCSRVVKLRSTWYYLYPFYLLLLKFWFWYFKELDNSNFLLVLWLLWFMTQMPHDIASDTDCCMCQKEQLTNSRTKYLWMKLDFPHNILHTICVMQSNYYKSIFIQNCRLNTNVIGHEHQTINELVKLSM